jgi:hypothetical protein
MGNDGGSRYVGFPELDVAAVRARLDASAALWYRARAVDTDGTGRVAVSVLGVARTKLLTRRLARGDALFWLWVRPGKNLLLRSPRKVLHDLGAERVTVRYVAPLDWLRADGRRARLALNAFATLRSGRPVSTATIAHACNVSRRTVFSWFRQTGWQRIGNFALLRPESAGESVRETLRLARKYADQPGRLRVVRTSAGIFLASQLPNSLGQVSELVKSRAALRRANRLLKPCVLRGRGQRQRLYVRPGERRRQSIGLYVPVPSRESREKSRARFRVQGMPTGVADVNASYIPLSTPKDQEPQLWLPPSIPPLITGEVFVHGLGRPRRR